MRYLFIVLFFYYYICSINCLNTNFQCTTSTSSSATVTSAASGENDDDETFANINTKTLTLDCKTDFIYIVWSHYGHESFKESNNQIYTKNSNNNTCNFSANDCIVNVDYVANECNGLNSCQISLDTQYLHSCKSYSDYIFILYDCVDASKTVNICSDDVNIQTNEELYLQAPNYPNEYSNNLNCNCLLDTNANQMSFQLLEFDLESSYDSEMSLLSNNIINSQSSSNSNRCSKDYFGIDGSRYCGTIGSYTNLYTNQNAVFNLKFTSDDSLTRRGFWIKAKGNNFETQCPSGFFLVDNKCIKVYDSLLTWFESKKFCTNLGYELVTIDDFESNKQLNRLLDEETKFWLGLKHLNGTHWFDEDNQVVYADSESWWPWLLFDSLIYKQGSCVAKHKHGLQLEDCYQRLKFACQYRLKESREKSTISLKCGKNTKSLLSSYKMKSTLINQNKLSSTSSGSSSTSTSTSSSYTQDSNYHEITDNTVNNGTRLAINNNNATLVERVYITNNKFYPDSTLFITLISSIVILIAFINFVVILILCRRRRLHKQEEDTHQHEYNVTGHGRQQHLAKAFCPASSSPVNGSDHVSYATTTESSDFLTFNTVSKQRYPTMSQHHFLHHQQQQQQQNYFLNATNNQSTTSTTTSSSIINDRSDVLMLSNDLNNHVYETISVYGNKCGISNSEYQQGKLAEVATATADFYNCNNLIIFPSTPATTTTADDAEILSRRLSIKPLRQHQQQQQQILNTNSKFMTFYNNFDNNENNRITKNSNYINDQSPPPPVDSFFTQNRTQQQTRLFKPLYNASEAVV